MQTPDPSALPPQPTGAERRGAALPPHGASRLASGPGRKRWRSLTAAGLGLSLVAASLGVATGASAPTLAGSAQIEMPDVVQNGVYSAHQGSAHQGAGPLGGAQVSGTSVVAEEASSAGAAGEARNTKDTATRRARGVAAKVKPIRVGSREQLTVIVNLRSSKDLQRVDALAKKHRAARKVSWSTLSVAVYAMPKGLSQAKTNAFTAALRKTSGVVSAGISGVVTAQPRAVRTVKAVRAPRAGVGPIAQLARSVQANKVATGKGVTVGVADEGIFDENPAVRGRVNTKLGASCVDGGRLVSGASQGRPNVSNGGHGTAVANVIVGSTKTGPSRGIAPGAKVASVRVVTAIGSIYPEASICAQQWALKHKLPILNMSYGVDWAGTLIGGIWDPKNKDQAAVITAMQRSQAYALKKGLLTVAAAGNDGADLARKNELADADTDAGLSSRMRSLPAELPGVLVVSMTQADSKIDPYSTVGLGLVDLAAQGTAKLANSRTGFRSMGGTSFASPAVAGAAALVKQKNPRFTPAKIASRLTSTATARTCKNAGTILSGQKCRASKGKTNFFGRGTLNAERAVKGR